MPTADEYEKLGLFYLGREWDEAQQFFRVGAPGLFAEIAHDVGGQRVEISLEAGAVA